MFVSLDVPKFFVVIDCLPREIAEQYFIGVIDCNSL